MQPDITSPEESTSRTAIDEAADLEMLYLKVRRGIWQLAQPVNFEDLERDGVLVKVVGEWYRLERPDDLPKSLWFGASSKVLDGQTLLQFHVDTERYQRSAKRVGVDWQAPEPH